jgi:hypothetical protein
MPAPKRNAQVSRNSFPSEALKGDLQPDDVPCAFASGSLVRIIVKALTKRGSGDDGAA